MPEDKYPKPKTVFAIAGCLVFFIAVLMAWAIWGASDNWAIAAGTTFSLVVVIVVIVTVVISS